MFFDYYFFHTLNHLRDISQTTPLPPGFLEERNKNSQESFNVLILGIDTWETVNARSDLLIVANVNPETRKINLLSIPRDTKVNLAGVGNTKIAHVYDWSQVQGGGESDCQGALKAVSDLLKTPIHYYIKLNLRGFRDFVDLVGGLDVYLDSNVKLTFIDVILPAGKQHICGDLALEFVRERFSLEDGDFDRQRNQFMVIKSLANKLLEQDYMKTLPQIFQICKSGMIETNFCSEEVMSLAAAFWGIEDNDFTLFQIPGEPAYDYDPLVKAKIFYWVPDLNKVEEIGSDYFR
ncbi:MAG: LCP family protein [Desulfotomaculaceae bacterium]|nr:LCP family protein [Desulfotomaculaceae bacterium]